MKCDIKKEILVGYFYQEISPDQKQTFEQHLANCPICKTTLEEFSKTSKLMQSWQEEASNLKLTFVEEQTNFRKNLQEAWSTWRGGRKFGLSVAAGLGVALVVLSLLGFEASYAGGEFGLRLGIWPRSAGFEPQTPTPSEAPVTRAEFEEWRRQSFQLVTEMVAAVQEQQNRETEIKLTQFVQELEARRLHDLKLVGEGLAVYQLTNEDRFRQANDAIQQLVKLASYQDERPQQLEKK